MDEYLKRSEVFEKRLTLEPLSHRDQEYLLFRMAGPLMQAKLHRLVDLAKVPKTFIHGNPHLDNYVKTFRGSAMIDFDRSRMGPYCWDIIRFLSSLSLKRDEQDGFLDRKVVEYFIDSYITHFLNPDIPGKQLKMLKTVGPEKWQMTGRDYLQANKRWAKKMRDFKVDPKSEMTTNLLRAFLDSRNEAALLDSYELKEAGMVPGSFGKQHFIFHLGPKNTDSHLDAIILDVKEVYVEKNTKFFTNPFPHNGLRMIEASKVFADGMEERLGYCTLNGKEYWGRQVPTFAVKVKKYLDKEEQLDFAYSVASELSKGHRKGLADPGLAKHIEDDFLKNFDKYYKVSKFLTYELRLGFETIKRKSRLMEAYRSW